MKNILSILFVFVLSLSVTAQSTSPRFGTGVRDNTGRTLTYKLTSYSADAVGNDTIFLSPNAYETILRSSSNITDSVNIKPSLVNCNLGDKLFVFVTKGTGSGAVRFPSSLFTCDVAISRYTIAANKTAIFTFVFNGSKFVMVSKMVQP